MERRKKRESFGGDEFAPEYNGCLVPLEFDKQVFKTDVKNKLKKILQNEHKGKCI